MLLADESRVDVNVDPQLHMACQSDLIRFCQEIESGQGQSKWVDEFYFEEDLHKNFRSSNYTSVGVSVGQRSKNISRT